MRRRRQARPRLEAHGRPGWRQWFPALVALGLLFLAPVLAHAQGAGADTVTLRWTAVGDDGAVGTAALYDVRVSQAYITADNWNAATAVDGEPAPLPSGSTQQLVVRGLTAGATYYFAMKVRDDAGNWSALSNIVTWDGTYDETPPPVPADLAAEISGDGIHLAWSPSAAADLAGYSVYRAASSTGPYTKLNADLITATEYQDDAVPEGATSIWYQVTATDVSLNESPRSAAVEGLGTSESPAVTWLIQTGYPNPSHVGDPVHVPVYLVTAGARLDVVDAAGRLVRRLDLQGYAPGYQEVEWDGLNDAGQEVTPGPYRVWLVAGETRRCTRLVRVP